MRISDWSSDVCSSDLLQGLGSGRIREGLIGDEDVIERKAMGNELLRLQPLRFNRLEKHRRADRIDKTRRARNIARPALFQMEVDFRELGRAACRARV